ncbi:MULTISPECIES: toll/interleukin-1 receptor domain-containing protein [unclassified Sphingomonas]|uniref:toll/interleukin-1 receptor domain-containing protein n=1 Tax=Novosphingobium rhizosphaerae TaxID=1551649 RepID=UPI0015C76F0B
MAHKIFLSHNHNDKPVVEPVAIKLAQIFGHDQVFYDSWSIQPGDGIIDRMNTGLEAPELVLFFVSKNSLSSGMVKLEWQNALYAASKGKTRIVPVRIDGCEMPPVLRQTLFIDMFENGLESTILYIINITQGQASFTPQHAGFSNLTFSSSADQNGSIEIAIRASHLMESRHNFLFLTKNSLDEIRISTRNAFLDHIILKQNFKGIPYPENVNAIIVKPFGETLTPDHSIYFEVEKLSNIPIQILAVFHEKGEGKWVSIPPSP